MTLRDKRQKEFADAFIGSFRRGILYLCPRFGKIRTSLLIFKALKPKRILIAYPDVKIKKSWEEEMKSLKFSHKDITFTTHLSLNKYENELYDLIVIDEIHLLSDKQIGNMKVLVKNNDEVLGLTGTLADNTQRTLSKELGLDVLAKYPISQAIEEGVVADYEIHIVKCQLDNKVVNIYKSASRTEKGQFEAYGSVITKMEKEGKDTFYLRLARMRIIQSSLAKMSKTKELLKEFSSERILVFCGQTAIADKLGCPVYHSKKGEKEVFEQFSEGKGNHLAVVKIGNTGVTYKPLNKIIINYFDSNAENLAQKINRCMAMEYNNSTKKAIIYIITTDEQVEQAWLKKALEFFDKSKITYD